MKLIKCEVQQEKARRSNVPHMVMLANEHNVIEIVQSPLDRVLLITRSIIGNTIRDEIGKT